MILSLPAGAAGLGKTRETTPVHHLYIQVMSPMYTKLSDVNNMFLPIGGPILVGCQLTKASFQIGKV